MSNMHLTDTKPINQRLSNHIHTHTKNVSLFLREGCKGEIVRRESNAKETLTKSHAPKDQTKGS